MSDKEILEKAIRKAIDGGWGNIGYDWLDTIMSDDAQSFTAKLFIFNHDFAKALWGEDTLEYITDDKAYHFNNIPSWHYHLWKMVIAPDPIKYLGENI